MEPKFTDEELLETWNKAYSIAQSLGFNRYADDIAQEVIEFILRGRKTRIRNLVIDSIRRITKTRPSDKFYDAKIGFFSAQSIFTSHDSEFDETRQDYVSYQFQLNQEDDYDPRSEIFDYVDYKTRAGMFISMYVENEINFKQIGELNDISESRVSQLIKSGLLSARKRFEKEKYESFYANRSK